MQFRNSLALEFEQSAWENGGAFNFSLELSYAAFDKNLYNKVLDEKKSSLIILESSVVIPLSKNIGFLFNGTFVPNSHPVFLGGIIFKGNK